MKCGRLFWFMKSADKWWQRVFLQTARLCFFTSHKTIFDIFISVKDWKDYLVIKTEKHAKTHSLSLNRSDILLRSVFSAFSFLYSFQQLLQSKISFSRLNGVLENTMKCHVWGFPACFCPAVMGGWWYLIFHKRPISALWIRFLRRCRCSVWIWLWASSRNTTLIFNQFLSGVSSVEAFSCPPLCLCF